MVEGIGDLRSICHLVRMMGGHDHTSTERGRRFRARRAAAGLAWRKPRPRAERRHESQGYTGWIAFDGEGATIEGRHRYMLLCAGDEGNREWTCRNLGGIPSEQALDFLVNVVPQNGQKVGFSLGYDWTKILQDVDRKVLYLLYHEVLRMDADGNLRPVYWRHWKLNRQGARTTISDLRTHKKITAWDCFRFHQCSFVTALDRWKVTGPEELERIARMKEERHMFAEADWSEGGDVERYCLEECHLLARMMAELCEAWDATGLPRRAYHGAGTLGGAMFQKHHLAEHLAAHPGKVDEAIRRAYFGGRFECSRIGIVPERVYGYDINSAYAHAERTHPSLHGRWKRGPSAKRTLAQLDPNERFILVDVGWNVCDRGSSPPAWAPFPVRTKTGTIVYPARGTGTYWLQEVQAAWRLFGQAAISVRSSWELIPREPEVRPFHFIDSYYQQRLRWGREGRGMILKTALAAGYGKTAQRVGKPKWHSLIWASRTTATARAMLLDAMYKASDISNILMLATDGLWSTEPLDLELGEQLGQWSLKTHERGVFIARPGVYFPLDPDEREESWQKTVKARGISRKLLKDHADEMIRAWEVGAIGVELKQRRFVGVKSGLRGPAGDEVDLEAEAAAFSLDPWPGLRRYIMAKGGLGAGDFNPVDIPGSIYRKNGLAPDLMAVEAPYECPEATGLWDPDEGAGAMLEALQRTHEAHRSMVRPAGGKLVMGEWIENQPVLLSFDPKPKRWANPDDRTRPKVLWQETFTSHPYDAYVVSSEAAAIGRELEMLMEQPDGWEIHEVAMFEGVPF